MSGERLFEIVEVGEANIRPAVDLLDRFFREEGYDRPFDRIAGSLVAMLAEGSCWASLALHNSDAIGVATVTTMHYVEWGKLGEIGDLYVLPDWRGRGVGRTLIEAALGWCRGRGCSAVSVVITPDGEARHRLSGLYMRHGFDPSGRTIMTRKL